MRPSSDILALPADLRQQLLAMPLTAAERNEVACALSQPAGPVKKMSPLPQRHEKRPAG